MNKVVPKTENPRIGQKSISLGILTMELSVQKFSQNAEQTPKFDEIEEFYEKYPSLSIAQILHPTPYSLLSPFTLSPPLPHTAIEVIFGFLPAPAKQNSTSKTTSDPTMKLAHKQTKTVRNNNSNNN